MASTAHMALRPQGALVHGSPHGQRKPSPALNTSLPAQVGCPMAHKRKWQRAFRHASLRSTLDLAETSQPAKVSAVPAKAYKPLTVTCHPSMPKPDKKLEPVSPTNYLTAATADERKEESMVYRRTVFGHPDWLRHRSSSRHYRHIFTIASSRVILALGPPVLALTGCATILAAYNESIIYGVLPHDLPLLKASALPFQLTAPALALLLVFRTNASYSRFDEARKFWGATLNRVRDLARQSLSYMGDTEDREQLLRHLVAFPYAFKAHMLKEDHLVQDMQGVLGPTELETLLQTTHRPNYLLQVISEVIANTPCLTDFQRINMDKNLTHFHDQVGGCERLFKTPLPLSYTRLTSRFLVIWHFFLPLCLWDACNWMVIPATFFSAAALFCIEEVGVLIEEPFSILPLHAICNSCETNVGELIRVHGERLQRGSKSANTIDVVPENGAADGAASAAKSSPQPVQATA